MHQHQDLIRKSRIKFLLRAHWQTYLWRVLLAACLILSVGIIQHTVVLQIPLAEIHPRLLIIPTLVGGIFGFLLTTVRLIQKDQHRQVELLALQERSLIEEIARRENSDERGQRLKYALQGSNDGLWDWNIQTGKVYYSKRWEQILGYHSGEVVNHVDSWRNALHPDDAKETFNKLENHLSGNTSQFLSEMRLRTRSGEWCWVLGRGQVVERDELGTPIRAVGTMTDISDKKRVDDALQSLMSGTAGTVGTEFFQNLVHSLSDVFNLRFALLASIDEVIPGRLNTLASWDTYFKERTTSCTAANTPCEVTINEGYHVVSDHIQQLYPEDESLKRLDGRSYLGISVYDQKGKVVGVIAMIDTQKLLPWKIQLADSILKIFAARASAEIERLRVESELIRQKERAQVTLHSIGDAVITTDAEGYVEYMNPIAENITGRHANTAIGVHLDKVCLAIDNNGNSVTNETLEVCLRTGSPILKHTHIRLQNPKGKFIDTEQTASPIKDKNGNLLGVVLVFRDVSNAREMARKMTWQATHDALTGLVNRREFEHHLTQLIEDSQQENTHHALLYMDLDQFKVVNDTCGHFAGDELLRQLTRIFKKSVRQSDTLARLGGDEFGILLNGCDINAARKMAQNLINNVQAFRFVWEEKIFHVGASIGMVGITPETESSTIVMKEADMACYAAKDNGRNRVYLYEIGDEVVEQRQVEMHWVSRVKQAIENNDFVIYGQRILSLKDDSVPHYEVLTRMRLEDGSIIPPGSFIPAAERYNVAVDIDLFVVESVFKQIQYGNIPKDIVLSINLSGKSLSEQKLLDFILNAVNNLHIKPASICFEITETAAIANMTDAIHFITSLRKAGFLFSLDDFGSGVSSFGYLKQLPVDFLKIDGSFVKDMAQDPIDAAMVSAINEIGHRMNKETIAEFVEDEDILNLLKSMGVDYAQGYHVHKPEPLVNIFTCDIDRAVV